MRVVPKRWGEERWLVNTNKYCLKYLEFGQHKSCSVHAHKIKEETFIVKSGHFIILLADIKEQAISTIELYPGDVLDIPSGMYHSIIGKSDNNVLMEISTHHEDSDSYRLETIDNFSILVNKEKDKWVNANKKILDIDLTETIDQEK